MGKNRLDLNFKSSLKCAEWKGVGRGGNGACSAVNEHSQVEAIWRGRCMCGDTNPQMYKKRGGLKEDSQMSCLCCREYGGGIYWGAEDGGGYG